MKVADAFRRGQEAHELDGSRLGFLDAVGGRDGGVSGGEHGVDDDRFSVVHIAWDLEVVFHRLQRFRVAIEPNVPHPGRWEDLEHAVENPDAGPQDRYQNNFFAIENRALHGRQGGLDLLPDSGEVSADFVREEHADFVQQIPKGTRAALLVPHQGELVLDKRMVDGMNLGGFHSFL